MIFITRKDKRPGLKYFGPYTNAWALRNTFEVLLKVFPVRSCSSSNFNRAQRSKRQCLLGDIGKCAAPCVGWISEEDHQSLAQKLNDFMESGMENLLPALHEEMQLASTNEEFERAARLRDQIESFEKAQRSTQGNFSDDLQNKQFSAYEFDGTSDYISVNNSTSLKSPSRFITMATWAKIRSFTRAIDNKDYSVLFCKSESNSDAQYRLAITPDGISVINNGKLGTITGGDFNTNVEWTHFAAVIEDSLLTYYRNGQLIGSMVLPSSFTLNKENKLFIGRDDPGGLEFFDGYLDDTRIYSRKLTSSEIGQLYASKTSTSFRNIETNSTSLKVYPNPFKNELTLELNETYTNSSVKVFDLQGKEIAIELIPSNNKFIIQPKSTLSPGTYLLLYTNDLGTKSEIIIAE
jgi:hypothetical protein